MSTETGIEEDIEYFEVKFGYENHEMPAIVFANYIKNLDALVQEISKTRGFPHRLIITAVEPGSVKIRTILATITTAVGIFAREQVNEFAFSFVKEVIGYYLQTSTLNNEVPMSNKTEDGDNIIITDSKNVSVTIHKNTYNYILTHTNTNQYVAGMNHALKGEPISGVQITHKQGNNILDRIDTTYSEIETLANIKSEEIVIYADKIYNVNNQSIKITRIDFKKSSGWRMIYDGYPRSVLINPEPLEFLQNESISEKDTFIVNISIIQKFDEKSSVYVNDTHLITDVIQHIPFEDPEQSLFENLPE